MILILIIRVIRIVIIVVLSPRNSLYNNTSPCFHFSHCSDFYIGCFFNCFIFCPSHCDYVCHVIWDLAIVVSMHCISGRYITNPTCIWVQIIRSSGHYFYCETDNEWFDASVRREKYTVFVADKLPRRVSTACEELSMHHIPITSLLLLLMILDWSTNCCRATI